MSQISYGIALAIMAVIIASGYLGARFFDRDAGGYRDGFFTHAPFPDKAVHAIVGYALALTLSFVLPAWMAVLTVAMAGAAYEQGQGFFSMYDLAADIIGALIAWSFIIFITGVI